MHIGIIGYGNHARRLLRLTEEVGEKESIFTVYLYRNVSYKFPSSRYTSTSTLDGLLDCDAILISSPNHTHFQYLDVLRNKYKGYILCEKPPVASTSELEALKTFSAESRQRLFFNFNYRFSEFSECLANDPAKYDLGRLVNVSIVSGHGLAFKESYKMNWRSDRTSKSNSIFENTAIHMLDLFIWYFGTPVRSSYFGNNIAKTGNTDDNCLFSCSFRNGASLSIVQSYTSPRHKSILLLYENGLIRYGRGMKTIHGPRDCFNEKGLFVEPPSIVSEQKDDDSAYSNSLRAALSFFYSKVRKLDKFDSNLFERSLETMEVILSSR